MDWQLAQAKNEPSEVVTRALTDRSGSATATTWSSAPKASTSGNIAAMARRQGLHVMTRDTKHFAATGVSVFDPWET